MIIVVGPQNLKSPTRSESEPILMNQKRRNMNILRSVTRHLFCSTANRKLKLNLRGIESLGFESQQIKLVSISSYEIYKVNLLYQQQSSIKLVETVPDNPMDLIPVFSGEKTVITGGLVTHLNQIHHVPYS